MASVAEERVSLFAIALSYTILWDRHGYIAGTVMMGGVMLFVGAGWLLSRAAAGLVRSRSIAGGVAHIRAIFSDPYKAALYFGLAVVAVGVGPTLFEYDSWLASVLMTGGIAVFVLGLFSIFRGLVKRGRRHEEKNVESDADDEGCMRSIYVIVLIFGLGFAVVTLGKSLDMSLTTFFVSVYIGIVVFAFVWSYFRECRPSGDGRPEVQ